MGMHASTGKIVESAEQQVDLRRKRTRCEVERILNRTSWLEKSDRDLVRAYFDRGLSAGQIGSLNGQTPRHIRRRVRQIIERLNDPRAAYVAAHRQAWGRARCAVGFELFLRGRSMREVSERLGLSLYSVRKHRDAIEAMTLADQPERAWQNSPKTFS